MPAQFLAQTPRTYALILGTENPTVAGIGACAGERSVAASGVSATHAIDTATLSHLHRRRQAEAGLPLGGIRR